MQIIYFMYIIIIVASGCSAKLSENNFLSSGDFQAGSESSGYPAPSVLTSKSLVEIQITQVFTSVTKSWYLLTDMPLDNNINNNNNNSKIKKIITILIKITIMMIIFMRC